MENLDVMSYAVRYNRFLLQQLEMAVTDAPSNQSALDFGAGNGRFLSQMSSRFQTMLAVETDGEYQEILRGLNASVFAELASIPNNSVDVAWSFNVLEHIQDDQEALTELVAKLKPGGQLVIFVPAFKCLYSRMDKMVGHVRRYRIDDLRQKTINAGAFVISARYADSLGFMAAAAYRVLGGSGVLTASSIRFYDQFIFPPSTVIDKLVSPFFGKSVLLRAVKTSL